MKRSKEDSEAKKARNSWKNGQWSEKKNMSTEPLPQVKQEQDAMPVQPQKQLPLSKKNKRAPRSDDEESDAPHLENESDSEPVDNKPDTEGRKKLKRLRKKSISPAVDEDRNTEGSKKVKSRYKVKTEREGEKAQYVCKNCLKSNKACIVVVRERIRKDAACSTCQTWRAGCTPSDVLKMDHPPNIALEDNWSRPSTEALPSTKKKPKKTASSSRVTQGRGRALLDNGESSGVSDVSSVHTPGSNLLVDMSRADLESIVKKAIENQMDDFKNKLTSQVEAALGQIMTAFTQQAAAAAAASASNAPGFEPARTTPSLTTAAATNMLSSTHDDGVPSMTDVGNKSVSAEESA